MPGFDGGAEWGGAAVDPNGIMYVNANEIAWMARLKPPISSEELARLTPGERVYATYCTACHGPNKEGNPKSGFPSLVGVGQRRQRADMIALLTSGKGMMPAFPMLDQVSKSQVVDMLLGREKNERATGRVAVQQSPLNLDGYVKFLDKDGYPASPPPWGSLNAVDLNTGQLKWKVTLGEFSELTAKGVPPTGTQNYGGPVVTAGGVIFIASTQDSMIRGFDTGTGKLLWKYTLPACGYATPCCYEMGGKEYLVISCGGTKLQSAPGDSILAFALP